MVFVVDFGRGAGVSRRVIGSVLFRHLVEQGQGINRASFAGVRHRRRSAVSATARLERLVLAPRSWAQGTRCMGALKA
jgi:hypothetical protein